MPGFEAAFAIVGLLAVAYLVLKKEPRQPGKGDQGKERKNHP
ncbi:PGF-CTERM sorting domain-containing protein [Patescibacteria group bacterium]